MDKNFSYCTNCISAQYFIFKNGQWVCEECGKPLQNARLKGTIATQLDRVEDEHGRNSLYSSAG